MFPNYNSTLNCVSKKILGMKCLVWQFDFSFVSLSRSTGQTCNQSSIETCRISLFKSAPVMLLCQASNDCKWPDTDQGGLKCAPTGRGVQTCPPERINHELSRLAWFPGYNVFLWFAGYLVIYLSGIASLIFKYQWTHTHAHTCTHTQVFTAQLAAGGTNCLSVATLHLLFILLSFPLSSLLLRSRRHTSPALNSWSSPPSNLFSSFTFLTFPLCLCHPFCQSLYNQAWPSLRTHTHRHTHTHTHTSDYNGTF